MEKEEKLGTDGRKSFIECGRTAFGVAKHNYLGNVAYAPVVSCEYRHSWTILRVRDRGPRDRIILRGIEPRGR